MSPISSPQVRQIAVESYRAGQGAQAHIASIYGVSRRTFQRWWGEYLHHGHTGEKPRGHRNGAFSGDLLDALEQYVASHPHASLAEIQEAFADRVTCSKVAIGNTLRRLGWRYGKNGYQRKPR